MAYRLPSVRVPLAIEDGPTIEVERVGSLLVQQQAVGLSLAFYAAKPAGQIAALRAAYEFFVVEAQPTWEIVDHRGPVLPTVGGLLRLDPALGLAFIEAWCATLPVPEEEVPTAVDELIPPGPVRETLKRELRSKRKG